MSKNIHNPFSTIEHAIATLKKGGMIILVDNENRENEGDLVIAADHITTDAINFMSEFGRGLVCLPLAKSIVEKLALPLMTTDNGSTHKTAFTVSIEAAQDIGSGISASDKVKTIKTAIASHSCAKDIISPGHIFPLCAEEAGVLRRAGHTEASVDLMRLAGLTEAAVICEILNKQGAVSKRDELIALSKEHALPLVRIDDLLHYRIQNECLIEAQAASTLPLDKHGDFRMTVFSNQLDKAEHFILVKPPVDVNQVPLVRIHSECITGDVFKSGKCDCGSQLEQSLHSLAEQGGVLIYLRQEGRGIGLSGKLRAYMLQEQGLDTVEANEKLGFLPDNRNYAIAFQILKYLGIEELRLLTNNPRKVEALEKYGLVISERLSLIIPPSSSNHYYLKTKQKKLGHLLEINEEFYAPN